MDNKKPGPVPFPLHCLFVVEAAAADNVGVETLVAVLRALGHRVSLVFDEKGFRPWAARDGQERDLPRLENFLLGPDPPNVLLLTVNTDYFLRARAIAREAKRISPGLPVCLGGPHPTHAYRESLAPPEVDFVCRGEAEKGLPAFLETLAGRRAGLPEGFYGKRGGKVIGRGLGELVKNLDSLPFPDKSDFYAYVERIRRIYVIMTGRGCTGSCTFCNSPAARRAYRREAQTHLRRRSVEDALLELRLAKERYRPETVLFWDDTFFQDRDWLLGFAERYRREIGIRFFCQTIPEKPDEEVIRALARAGLFHVEVGVESLHEPTRARVFGRTETNGEIRDFVAALKRHGIYVTLDHIINPWDNAENLREQVLAYARLRPDWINVFTLLCYPGAAIGELARKDGYLPEEDFRAIRSGVLADNYFRGGSVPRGNLKKLRPYMVLLYVLPWLPEPLVRLLARPLPARVLSFIPLSIMYPVRFFNACFRKGDFMGRLHIRHLFSELFGKKQPAPQERLGEIQGISKAKPMDFSLD